MEIQQQKKTQKVKNQDLEKVQEITMDIIQEDMSQEQLQKEKVKQINQLK